MIAVVQRVTESCVTVGEAVVGRIGPGLVVLLGVARGDQRTDADYLSDKIVNLRIFEDDDQKMNRSLKDVAGQMLVVSQFTLLGDCKKGRRPSFSTAAPPDEAEALYTYFIGNVRKTGIQVETGRFQAMMAVSLVNDGPVTLILNS
jgi:D-aminoacyl-tRNA deacylase